MKDRGNGSKEVPQVAKGVWKGGIRKDASQESLGSCNRFERRV